MMGTELLLEGFANDYVADTAEDGDIWMVDG
jgi:glutamate synthase domain-containing protein 3